ncbi:hypothetical protein [Natrinema sp. SYSU A 869]|uniref:homing endonuclease associated repeat-containing protein n=1 Tax=Natrinema sp. SYSU A 869 TaxID=2871694 RepID=UPI001CA4426B|nr:hypothetical protein [Natrinema sp. SYSU A 869]
MTEKILKEIDGIINEELPEDPSEVTEELNAGQKQELLQILQHSADELGKSPTISEYNSLGLKTSASTIRRAFGTWNEAKREAGLETWQRGTVVSIDESYFQQIDSVEKSYWLGALFARSSLQKNGQTDNKALNVGRAESKDYFVREFATAIESEYQINKHSKEDAPNQQDTVQLHISNPNFVENLISAGYPLSDDDIAGFPSFKKSEYRSAFVRGYLESAGYFSTQGWNISIDSIERAETLQEWFKEAGAKRPTLSKKGTDAAKVRVANVFDIRSIFDMYWPDQMETEPSWKPYPEKVMSHLKTEYPYPENVPYLPE